MKKINSLIVVVCCVIISCKGKDINPCLQIPILDTTPPEIGISIEFYLNGKSITKTLTGDFSSTTINADKTRPVAIIYSGIDNEGMKFLYIDVKEYRSGLSQQLNYTTLPVESGCPRKFLINSWIIGVEPISRSQKIRIEAKNWKDLITWSEYLTIIPE